MKAIVKSLIHIMLKTRSEKEFITVYCVRIFLKHSKVHKNDEI